MADFWKNKLTPYDTELCIMVESLTGKPCEPLCGAKNDYFIVVDYSNRPESDFVAAVMAAIEGRVGERFESISDKPEEKRFIVYIKFSEQDYPKVCYGEEVEKAHPAIGDVYCRQMEEVLAMYVDRGDVDALVRFVGNGHMEIEKRMNGNATFIFRNACGSVWNRAPEHSYIVYLRPGLYKVVPKDEFEREYEPK